MPSKRPKQHNITRALSSALELPEEVVLNLPLISIIGRGELTIENHKGILEYSASLVRINTNSSILSVAGRDISIKQITSESIKIEGVVSSIQYSD